MFIIIDNEVMIYPREIIKEEEVENIILLFGIMYLRENGACNKAILNYLLGILKPSSKFLPGAAEFIIKVTAFAKGGYPK
ncbi:MAG TPA: hypothetical protein VHT73_12650 [Thermodesulfobacteriota bacterium]|nr:hypothetical protein [Thermodesulfobacteriota bacterium]